MRKLPQPEQGASMTLTNDKVDQSGADERIFSMLDEMQADAKQFLGGDFKTGFIDAINNLRKRLEREPLQAQTAQAVDANSFVQPGWHHVGQAFIDGAREARINPDAEDADFIRAADGYSKQIFEQVDPENERRIREDDWPQVLQFTNDHDQQLVNDLREEIRCLKNKLAAPQQAVAASSEPPALLNAEEMAAFNRCVDCFDDGEGYDVPKSMMSRLAQIGVLRHVGKGVYETTEFGMHVLKASTNQPVQVKALTAGIKEQE